MCQRRRKRAKAHGQHCARLAGDAYENDLATQGLGLYAAFIPFLLFVLAYSNGFLGFGYSNGNF